VQRSRIERARERLRTQAAERDTCPGSRAAGTRSITPNRRGSLKMTVIPDDMLKTTCGVESGGRRPHREKLFSPSPSR
jgi:hypothetical protein